MKKKVWILLAIFMATVLTMGGGVSVSMAKPLPDGPEDILNGDIMAEPLSDGPEDILNGNIMAESLSDEPEDILNGDIMAEPLSDGSEDILNGDIMEEPLSDEPEDILYGDVNQDGVCNMKDIVLLQKKLNGFDVDLDEEASDVVCDGKINMKDIVLLQRYLNGHNVVLGPENADQFWTSMVYGTSEQGRNLNCFVFTPKNYTHTVLLNFAIHGYEDEYPADGKVLVDAAEHLVDYYKNNREKLGQTRLLIVPCANPDGLYAGSSNNGFGRCNAKGIDLNRDFDANYLAQQGTRNYTPYAFSAAESRALRDLVLAYTPGVVLDFHGWLDETIGDYEVASVFAEEMDLQHYVSYSDTNGNGYFSNWAHQQGALGVLVEFKNSSRVSLDQLEKSVNRILAKDYPILKEDARFREYDRIDSYTLSQGRTTTCRFAEVPYAAASYIDGASDKVSILAVYENGWVKTQYPVTGGDKIGYCKLTDFISEEDILSIFRRIELDQNRKVYRRKDLSEEFGTAYQTDEVTVVGETTDALQILYPLDAGGYKMGWIRKQPDLSEN